VWLSRVDVVAEQNVSLGVSGHIKEQLN